MEYSRRFLPGEEHGLEGGRRRDLVRMVDVVRYFPLGNFAHVLLPLRSRVSELRATQDCTHDVKLRALRLFVCRTVRDRHRRRTFLPLPRATSVRRGRPDSSQNVLFQLPILNQGLNLTLELIAFGRQMPVILVVLTELVPIPLRGILR